MADLCNAGEAFAAPLPRVRRKVEQKDSELKIDRTPATREALGDKAWTQAARCSESATPELGDVVHVLLAFTILTVISAFVLIAHGVHVTLVLPPLRCWLEIYIASALASSLNMFIAIITWVLPPHQWPVLSSLLLLALLPLPYLIPPAWLKFQAPCVVGALLLWIGVWKGLDAAGGTGPTVGARRTGFRSLAAFWHLIHFMVPVEYRRRRDGSCEPDLMPIGNRHWPVFAGRLICRGAAFAMLLSAGECTVELAGTGWAIDMMREYYHTWIIFFQLAMTTDSSDLALSIFGCTPSVTFRDPLTRGTSPSDFWGRRWNLLVHRLFRRTIFQPLVLRGVPAAAAAALAFFVSGAFHEYAFFAAPAGRLNAPWLLGCNFGFFLVQAAIVALEKLLEKYLIPRLPSSLLCAAASPVGKVMQTGCSTLLLVPFAWMFMKPLAELGVLHDMKQLFPKLVPVYL
mmetsp:Transcript_18129/g.30282  ORF Transcript_18129/g.30282 Transcript_18129/m.30282 type:complete len:458 (-) Transcript_18129:370-1743(-)